jgi:hypothetical protein
LRSDKAKNSRDSILTNKSWVLWHAPIILATAESLNRRSIVQPGLGKKHDLILKSPEQKGWEQAHVGEHLRNNCKTLSNLSTTKTNEKQYIYIYIYIPRY